jgi:hypothetical protein
MNKIFKTIIEQYKKDKVSTIFMGLVLLFALLTFIKPSSASGLSNYIGLTAINLLVILIIGLIIWLIFFRRKR